MEIKQNKLNFFQKFIDDKDFDVLSNLSRFNGVRRIQDETVAHHTFLVTWFTRMLVEEMFESHQYVEKLRIVDFAMFHDVSEMFTGDIVYPLKYNKHNGDKIRVLLKEYADLRTVEKFSSGSKIDCLFMSNLMEGKVDNFHKMIVKIADWLSCIFYVNKEIKLGNKELIEMYRICVLNVGVTCLKLLEQHKGKFDERIVREIAESNFEIL